MRGILELDPIYERPTTRTAELRIKRTESDHQKDRKKRDQFQKQRDGRDHGPRSEVTESDEEEGPKEEMSKSSADVMESLKTPMSERTPKKTKDLGPMRSSPKEKRDQRKRPERPAASVKCD